METETHAQAQSSKASVVTLAAAWLAVGLPLLWGVAQTIKKAMALFG
jgi:hypothetical protein